MIDSGKVNAAVNVLSKLPTNAATITGIGRGEDFQESEMTIEYPDYSVRFLIEHGTADPDPYIEILSHGHDLLRYFVEKAIVLNKEKEELLLAFRVTFNALIEENAELKQKILELEEMENNNGS